MTASWAPRGCEARAGNDFLLLEEETVPILTVFYILKMNYNATNTAGQRDDYDIFKNIRNR
jgi:hypothetical protein